MLRQTEVQDRFGGENNGATRKSHLFYKLFTRFIIFCRSNTFFANKLRSEGIDAILDQYEEAPSEGWPRWMENSINRADYVIVIGSKGYYDKI